MMYQYIFYAVSSTGRLVQDEGDSAERTRVDLGGGEEVGTEGQGRGRVPLRDEVGLHEQAIGRTVRKGRGGEGEGGGRGESKGCRRQEQMVKSVG